jgi:hypothetical protein
MSLLLMIEYLCLHIKQKAYVRISVTSKLLSSLSDYITILSSLGVVFSMWIFMNCIFLACIVVILCVFVVLCVCCSFTLDAGLLAKSQYPEGPATGHFGTRFSWFPCVYKRMLRWFPSFQVATTCFSCSPPDLDFLVAYFIFVYM